jgi:hypothetical protein
LFADAVRPTHAVRPVGCWVPKDVQTAVPQTSGRPRLNIHGAIDLETARPVCWRCQQWMVPERLCLLMAIEAMYPGKRVPELVLAARILSERFALVPCVPENEGAFPISAHRKSRRRGPTPPLISSDSGH